MNKSKPVAQYLSEINETIKTRTGFNSFAHMVNTKGAYVPTLKIDDDFMLQLADAYDGYQQARNDKRRVYRYIPYVAQPGENDPYNIWEQLTNDQRIIVFDRLYREKNTTKLIPPKRLGKTLKAVTHIMIDQVWEQLKNPTPGRNLFHKRQTAKLARIQGVMFSEFPNVTYMPTENGFLRTEKKKAKAA